MATTTSNGVTITYEEQGAGQPLLLVMGLGAQLIDWPEGFVDRLAQHFRVIRFDNRDSGLSTEFSGPGMTSTDYFKSIVTRRKPEAIYTLSDMAGDAIAVLDAVGADRAHVVGASMGGMISQTVAIEHPERVISLTSIMSNTGDGKRGGVAPKLMVKLARRPEPSRATAINDSVSMSKLICGPTFDEVIARELAELSVTRSFRPEGTARQLAAINASPDRTAKLASVNVPTLVIHGLADPLVLPSGGIATAKAIEGSRLLMFPDMGHDLPENRWAEVVEAIVWTASKAKQMSSASS